MRERVTEKEREREKDCSHGSSFKLEMRKGLKEQELGFTKMSYDHFEGRDAIAKKSQPKKP
jgi:hypothetical protein